jgi:hypothetical protein
VEARPVALLGKGTKVVREIVDRVRHGVALEVAR